MKRSMYEGGIREPAIARWPGKIKPGTTSDTPWAFYDFLPTAAELTGQPLPAGVKTDGVSIVPALLGGTMPKREYLYWELHEPRFMQAVRMGDWKGIRYGSMTAPMELYDLAKDLAEKQDVAAGHPEVVARIASLMKAAHVESRLFPDAKAQAPSKAPSRVNARRRRPPPPHPEQGNITDSRPFPSEPLAARWPASCRHLRRNQ